MICAAKTALNHLVSSNWSEKCLYFLLVPYFVVGVNYVLTVEDTVTCVIVHHFSSKNPTGTCFETV